MRILGIDTSTKTGSVALIQNEVVLAEYTHSVTQGHSSDSTSDSWLISAIDRILQDGDETANRLKIDGIAVIIGPGAFTGLRIGVSTAKGLGYSLGIQIAEVTSLDALAANIPNGFVCPIMNAMREEVYAAFYENGKRKSEYMLIKPEDLAQRITGVRDQGSEKSGNHQIVTFLGDGVRLWEEFFATRLSGMVSFAPAHNSYLKAATVASIGMKMLLEGKGKKPEEIVPLYLRVSNAEQQRK